MVTLAGQTTWLDSVGSVCVRERERERERAGLLPSLCGEWQTLVHTLNTCKVALDQRRYNKRHDEVSQAIASTVAEKLPSTTSFTTDLGDTY